MLRNRVSYRRGIRRLGSQHSSINAGTLPGPFIWEFESGSVKDFAAKVGYHPNRISALKSATRGISPRLFRRMVEAYKLGKKEARVLGQPPAGNLTIAAAASAARSIRAIHRPGGARRCPTPHNRNGHWPGSVAIRCPWQCWHTTLRPRCSTRICRRRPHVGHSWTK